MSALLQTEHPHVRRDHRGRPVVGSGNLEVHILARLWQLEVPVEELASDYPYLSKGEILDALSYYCDHQAEVDALIAGNRVPEELSASAG